LSSPGLAFSNTNSLGEVNNFINSNNIENSIIDNSKSISPNTVSITNHPDRVANQPSLLQPVANQPGFLQPAANQHNLFQPEASTPPNRGFVFPVR
jgi:hypothetical protein